MSECQRAVHSIWMARINSSIAFLPVVAAYKQGTYCNLGPHRALVKSQKIGLKCFLSQKFIYCRNHLEQNSRLPGNIFQLCLSQTTKNCHRIICGSHSRNHHGIITDHIHFHQGSVGGDHMLYHHSRNDPE